MKENKRSIHFSFQTLLNPHSKKIVNTKTYIRTELSPNIELQYSRLYLPLYLEGFDICNQLKFGAGRQDIG